MMRLPVGLKGFSRNTWLHPSYLDLRELKRGILQASQYASGDLLDVGCGRKPYLDLFARKVTRYIGVDMSSSLYDSSLVDVFASALGLPFPLSHFDTVLCTEVLEHVPEPWNMLKELARVLQPGGILILTAPFCSPVHEAPRDFFRYTVFGLEKLLEQAGFTVEHIQPRGDLWTVIGYQLSSWVGSRVIAEVVSGRTGRAMVYGIFALPVCALIQLFSAFMTAVLYNPRATLGHVVVARKAIL